MTRHTNNKHQEKPTTSNPPEPTDEKITVEDLNELVKKSFKTVADSDLHLSEIRAEAKSYASNPPAIQNLHLTLNEIPRKNNEKFTTKFYATFLINPCQFLPIANRSLAALALTKLCVIILGEKKRKTKNESVSASSDRLITNREKAGLQYLGGYILRNIFFQLKKKNQSSPSNDLEEMMALLKSCKTDVKPENQRLVFALDRGGLWYTENTFFEMIVEAEKIFFPEVIHRIDIRTIDYVTIICKMMKNPDIRRLFHEHSTSCDIDISDTTESAALHSILHLFVKIRAFNYTKDYVQKQRLKNVTATKKALRTNLKNLSTPMLPEKNN